LTMRFAKANDIWLHARGSGGSHAVLRMSSKEAKPPKQILIKAAEITAYYSQARNAKYTPVCYTYKKYVHKPKGSNPGSVVISKEEVIMVEPKLPKEQVA
ncbi:MAG: NFACT RNA binding domain-containing protein, partial [Bacteroidota bacterium]